MSRLLEISISTNKEDIGFLIDKIHNQVYNPNLIYTIIWQNSIETKKETWLNKNVRIVSFHEKGLSRSRNRALELALGDVLLFSDDDIIFEKDIYKKIIKAYKELPDADIITFKAYTAKKPFKKYSNKYFKHNILSIMHVSSWEISCKPKRIKEVCLKFNELFGLGSVFPSSEENLFLWDALSKGLNVYFYPEFIVTHPSPKTSSHNFSPEILKSKGAFFYEVFGNLSYLLIPIFAVKKLKLEPNIFKSMLYMFKGQREYIMLKRKMSRESNEK